MKKSKRNRRARKRAHRSEQTNEPETTVKLDNGLVWIRSGDLTMVMGQGTYEEMQQSKCVFPEPLCHNTDKK